MAADAAAGRWLERMGLADRAKSKLEELSHGNQQRIQLAIALVHDPELLVLDEPFSGLDPIGIATMTEVVHDRAAAGVGVVFSSHQLDLVEDVCEDVVIIARGRIVAAGAIDELKARSGRRHLEVEVVGSDGSWLDGDRDLTVLGRVGDRVKLLVRRRRRPRPTAGAGARRRGGPDVRLPATQAVRAVHGGRDPGDAGGWNGGLPVSRWRSIWLVARREIVERGRSRGFVLSVLFTTALVIGSFLVPPLLFGEEESTKIGLVDPPPAGLALTIEATAAQFGQDVEVVTFGDAATAEAALQEDTVDVVAAIPADLSSPGVVRFAKEPDQAATQIVAASVIALRMGAALADSDVEPEALVAAQQVPTVDSLDPQTEADGARFLFANIGAVLILIGIFSFGFTVLTGVVEEKQSRVVEVVLSTVRARDLLMGKVLGIGILGLVQLAVFVVAALGAAILTNRFVLPSTTPAAIGMLTLWFVLGYALYSTALGFLGALASRIEEASNASTPVTMVAMISYFVAIFAVINDPSGLVAQVTTYLPPSAPFVVPLRAAFDAIGPIEILIAVLITVVAIWALFTVGARVYAGAVLQTAGRMKLRDAWRSAGE